MMKTVQLHKGNNTDWQYLTEEITLNAPLVLVFGNRYMLENENIYKRTQKPTKNYGGKRKIP